MNFLILPLNEDDLVECSHLFVNTFKHEPWNEDWAVDDAFKRLRNFLSSSYSIGLKVVNEDEIQGFLVGEIEQWRGYQSFYLKEMCVSKKLQRSGLGRELMRVLQIELVKKGVLRIYLITQRKTVPEKFYKSLDFATNDSLIIMGKSIEANS
jgi:ribosomal protein S18 acetylase RimI-like enzyme